MSFPQPHHSLPARPQGSASGSFKPAFAAPATSTTNGAPGTEGFRTGGANFGAASRGAFTAFKPRAVAPTSQDWRNSPSSISAAPAPPTTFASPYSASGYQHPQPQIVPQYPYQQQAYPQLADNFAQPTPPQIRNPFPLPGQDPNSGRNGGKDRFGTVNYDPEEEARIAQWQSQYAPRDEVSSRGPTGPVATAATTMAAGPRTITATPMTNSEIAAVPKADNSVASIVSGTDGKQKTVVRSGGGESWQDSSLLEWDPAHFRLFVGNLAGEVTDESLLKAFAKYDSVQKARVVREKRTTKSKGYGFVSFSDGDQFFKAAKEMQGKYIGSHPVILRRSTTEIKAVVPSDKHKKGKGDRGAGGGQHAKTGAGVQKKQSKTKGGLKILG